MVYHNLSPHRRGAGVSAGKGISINRVRRVRSGSGQAGAAGEQGVEGDVVEEGEFEADGDDLAEVGGEAEVLAAGAEFGEGSWPERVSSTPVEMMAA